MTPSAQLAEIRERIAQIKFADEREHLEWIAADLRSSLAIHGELGRLALALVSAEVAAGEQK